jgi:hypothetical protein
VVRRAQHLEDLALSGSRTDPVPDDDDHVSHSCPEELLRLAH